MSIRGFWSSTSQFLSSNRLRFLFVSVAGVGAATAAVYARRQYGALQAVLAAERAAGAGVLRAAFFSNARTTESALQALLPLLRSAVRAAPGADVDVVVRQLRMAQHNREDKRAMWTQLQRVTFVELVGAACLVATLQATLALQLNLLGRHSATPSEVEPLPSHGPLRTKSRDVFLSRVRTLLLAPPAVASFLDKVATLAAAELATLSLKDPMHRNDAERFAMGLAKRVLQQHPQMLSPVFLFGDVVTDDSDSEADVDLQALFDESIDLAAALEFDLVVEEATEHLIDVMLDNVTAQEWGVDRGTPCAQLLAPLHRAANDIMERVPDSLRTLPAVEQLGAAVLLSGEREWRVSGR